MTYLTPTVTVHALSFVERIVTDFFDNRKKRLAEQQTVYSLGSLDGSILKDIAISRSEINSVVYNYSGDRKRRFVR